MTKPKTIDEAITARVKVYYPDKLCIHGHDLSVVGKFVTSKQCCKCNSLARKEAYKQLKERIAKG